MLLKEVKFSSVAIRYDGLCIKQGGKTLAEGFIGEVLRNNPQLANEEILTQRPYFNQWVIELKIRKDVSDDAQTIKQETARGIKY